MDYYYFDVAIEKKGKMIVEDRKEKERVDARNERICL